MDRNYVFLLAYLSTFEFALNQKDVEAGALRPSVRISAHTYTLFLPGSAN